MWPTRGDATTEQDIRLAWDVRARTVAFTIVSFVIAAIAFLAQYFGRNSPR